MMGTDYEPTRLHRLTDEEADLIVNYRLMGAAAKQVTVHLVKSQAAYYVDLLPSNVVSIARPSD